MLRHHRADNRDVVEFEYGLQGGETVQVEARAKVYRGDHTSARPFMTHFSINVYRNNNPDDGLTCIDLKGEWSRIEDEAADRLYDDFIERCAG